jgi:predicted RNase H-like HicB family nuclease
MLRVKIYHLEALIMQYQVLVQSHTENKFIASIIGIPNSTVEGATKEEAVFVAKAALETQLALGELYYVRLHAHNKTHAKTQRRKESKNILLWVCYRT